MTHYSNTDNPVDFPKTESIMDQLMYESGLTADGSFGDMDQYDQEAIMRFAELIVGECAKFTFKYTSDEKNIQEYNKIGWDLLSGDLRDAIKEHFGVEE